MVVSELAEPLTVWRIGDSSGGWHREGKGWLRKACSVGQSIVQPAWPVTTNIVSRADAVLIAEF